MKAYKEHFVAYWTMTRKILIHFFCCCHLGLGMKDLCGRTTHVCVMYIVLFYSCST